MHKYVTERFLGINNSCTYGGHRKARQV